MSHPFASDDPDDEILAQIMQELDRSGGAAADTEAYVARYPHLAREIRDLFAMRVVLERSRARIVRGTFVPKLFQQTTE